jgi:hypothetical protein
MSKITLQECPVSKSDYAVGQFWLDKTDDNVYLLTDVIGVYYLIDVESGSCHSGGSNTLEGIFENSEDFVLITKSFTVTP